MDTVLPTHGAFGAGPLGPRLRARAEPLSLGALARDAGVNPETIRYYERRGLLPEPPRTPAGYRQYSAADAERVALILRAKDLGFTLAEIGELLDGGPGSPGDVLAAA